MKGDSYFNYIRIAIYITSQAKGASLSFFFYAFAKIKLYMFNPYYCLLFKIISSL